MTTNTTINFDLLDAGIEDAATGAHGYEHDQSNWVAVVSPHEEPDHPCGTAMCLAGFVAIRAGAEVPKPIYDYFMGAWDIPYWDVNPETGQLDSRHGVHVATFARKRLGISDDQADALFAGSNTLRVLRAMRDYLRDNPDATYAELNDIRIRNH
ncbi:hypothetical protein [Micromonospora sp. WMMD736]|uniref:hypothetical protein n=1 Tax=Micromonospora sp. WMMD736 TaxID=3404112 RepID=UPI003B959AB4